MAKPWAEALDAAEKRGRFTKRDIDRAWSYTTCATSEYRGRFKEAYRRLGIPAGQRLGDLSIQFTDAVTSQDVTLARRTYNRIQAYFRRKR